MTTTQFPLREKRKAQTRASLIKAATELFARKGYEDATLEEIAEHAGLHVQTLYRHFPTKQDLATAGDQERLDRFRAAITDPDRMDTTFEFWRAWMVKATKEIGRDGGERYRQFLRSRWSPPTVSTRLLAIGNEYEDLLTESLARDFAEPADQIGRPRLVAIMLWGANAHVARRHAVEQNFNVADEAITVIDRIEGMFKQLLN